MAKKIQKKAAKKSAKKTAKKAVKKAGKAGARKASAKKATAKKASKKTARPAKKVAKKAAKKVAKKVAKKAGKKAAPKKVVRTAAKAVKKAAKKVAKKVARKVSRPAPRRTPAKKSGPISNFSSSVAGIVKDALTTVINKVTPERSEESSGSQESNGGSGASEKGSNEEEEEEEHRPRFKGHQTRLTAGKMAPYFEGVDQAGRKVSLYSLSGKTIILYFYPKDDTEGCTATSCSLRDEYNFLTEYNYAVVGVSADDEKSHLKFANKYNLPFSLLADTDKTIIKAYDVWGQKQLAGKIFDGIVRTTFLIDCYGMIRNVITDVDTKNHARQILAL